ncbi:Rho GTPase activating protein 19, isoform CRA_b [Homo sapiens]
MIDFCIGTNESGVKNPAVVVKEHQEILTVPEGQNRSR